MTRHVTALLLAAAVAAAQESRRSAFDASAMRPIFDGRSLDGWVTKGGRYDGDASWTVEDGAICGREGPGHAGGLLYTSRRHACFLLSLEVWMTRPNDSGIFVRMAPEGRGAQVTLDDRDDGEVGAVYSDEFLAHNTTARARWRPQAWNRVEVRVTGRDLRVEAWINGEKTTDHRVPAGTPGFAPTGLVGLQVHGNRDDPPGTVVRFRDVRIRELPVFELDEFTVDEQGVMTPTEAGKARGWRPLALTDPAAWENDGFWSEEFGSFIEPRPGGGVLRSKADFRDFELLLDVRLAHEGGNSGIFLRADRGGGNPAFSGCEIQVLDDADWERIHGSKLEPWQLSGSIYGSSAPRVRGVPHPAGWWNSYRIRYEGTRLRVDLNGTPLQDADVAILPVPEGEKPFSARAPTGFIGIQRYGSEREPLLRNVFVRSVP
jgi:hypothetical protein